MAQKLQVLLLDDVDGSEAAETVSFGLDGVTYEIDLSASNAAEFRKELSTWTESARRTGGRRSTTKAPGTSNRHDLTKVRDWARDNGYSVSDRGRVSREIQEAYDKSECLELLERVR
ncbi:Lsr2 family protein [Luteipulveratus sp. YIM 133132]|uniref:histone-like nucleoid-structuring protein Lsr2 n=1 Tax=Luteipulveratus flavus TaxID=3031728 RepID=UPI0023B1429A|nr:Lsr2 family protein [Luteipulveratus sp. YIM 133132]MDE9364442.1 Lsr2 family protein [Luteipulveratus sp. YIM 133132]